ncbi:MAG TPA: hypothetical protein VFF13_02220 [archaeon]|nr:hypothetical protein [archaeon]
MSKGIIFSMDALIACMIFIFSVSLLLSALNTNAEQNIQETKWEKKELFAFALSEAIVKNRDAEKPVNGAVYFNHAKKRNEANIIDKELLEKIHLEKFSQYSLNALYERNENGTQYYFHKQGERCITIERFVLIKEIVPRKTVLGFVVCEN